MKFKISSIHLCFIILILLFIPKIGNTQEDALDLFVNSEDKATIEDITQETSKETQEKLQEALDNWAKLEKYFAILPKAVQDKINEINRSGLRNKIKGFQSLFKQFDSGLNEILDKKEKLDILINFYSRYKPDSQNPFRSLEVLNNVFTDIESLLPEEQEYEFFKNTTIWLIRTGIGYYKEAIGNALAGLKNIQKQIRDRAGDCIGYIGGDGTADSSDPKRKAFIDLKTGDLICYTGLRPIGSKIYTNTNGDGVYIWDAKKWTKLNCDLGTINNIFMDWKLSNGIVISSDDMIYWCNKQLVLYNNSRSWALLQFDKLNSINGCQDRLIQIRDKTINLNDLMESVFYDKKLFVAKYNFPNDNIRENVKLLTDIIDNTVLFEGSIKDINGKIIQDATVSITTEIREKSTYTSEYGKFNMLAEIPKDNQNDMPIKITVTAANYTDFETTTRIYKQCQSLGILELSPIGSLSITPENSTVEIGETIDFIVLYTENGISTDVTDIALNNSSFTGTNDGSFSVQASYNNHVVTANIEVEKDQNCDDINEIWDATIGDCICRPGYIKNDLDECVEIEEDSTTILPPVQITLAEINNQLNNADCANVSDAVAKWDPVSEQVICNCLKDYHTWDSRLKKCVPNVQAILANSDCSQWPNSEPKWDYNSNEPYCDCISGYEWSEDFLECISKQDLLVAQTDCSHYPNTQAVWDPVAQEVACDCLPGFEWDKDYTKCISLSQSEMQDIDCSMYPNTTVVWDQVSQQAFCDCLPGFEWNEEYSACEKIVQEQIQYDCSHLPNSRPIFDPVLNEAVCDCLPGYQWNRNFTACISIPKKPTVDWNSIISMTVDIMNTVNGVNGINNTLPSGYGPGAGNATVPANQQPPVMHQSNCNDQQQAGGDPPEVHTIDLGQSYGSFMFDYDTVSQEDQIIVTNGGRTIFNSGCVGESKSIRLNLTGFSPTITVRVNPNCNGGSGTQWYFTVHCPDN